MALVNTEYAEWAAWRIIHRAGGNARAVWGFETRRPGKAHLLAGQFRARDGKTPERLRYRACSITSDLIDEQWHPGKSVFVVKPAVSMDNWRWSRAADERR